MMTEDIMPKTEVEVQRGKTAWDEWRERNGIERKERPRAKPVPVTEEMLERRAEIERKQGEYAQRQRLKELSGRMGGGGGGGMKPDTDITASRKLPKMAKGGKVKSKVSSASKRADGCAQRGKTRGKFV